MPYVRCQGCGLMTYCATRDDCPRCGARLDARAHASVIGALELVRRELGVDGAVVSEVADGRETVRFAAPGEAFPSFRPGTSVPLEDTLCNQLLEGNIASLVPDVAANEHVRDLSLPRAAGIRAYLGVPLDEGAARLYLLCCLHREARPDLGEDDVRFLRGLAESLALSAPFCDG